MPILYTLFDYVLQLYLIPFGHISIITNIKIIKRKYLFNIYDIYMVHRIKFCCNFPAKLINTVRVLIFSYFAISRHIRVRRQIIMKLSNAVNRQCFSTEQFVKKILQPAGLQLSVIRRQLSYYIISFVALCSKTVRQKPVYSHCSENKTLIGATIIIAHKSIKKYKD